ncbi:MAG: SDR family oxidoreductase [Bacillati bacterium ANGP1]|uniref:SDR family oxidoreductase n=1 Tax=Candidatus Segetimicrobium genomatis TaxID=2569760 RepID=A0A537JPX0_9BACT|nr:MAG: SDR family oxidoreductase [Terrabacteria group bacterium ANGP1]
MNVRGEPVRLVPDQVVLVTGATDGLGKAVARELASRRATVLLHGRDTARGEATLHEVRQATGNDRLRVSLADFSSLAQVRRLAEAILAGTERLDLLINNAGVGGTSPRQESQDGHELRFAVNYLAPFLLTHLLLPLLRRSAPARIVNVASAGQAPIDFDDVMLTRAYEPLHAYRQSKLAQIMHTFELAERLRAQGETHVTVNALHPASLMPTKMVFEMFGAPMSTLEEGTEATLHLAISPDLDGVTGRYFNGRREARALEQAYDPEARRRLWAISEQLCGLAGTAPTDVPPGHRPSRRGGS